MSRRCLHLRCSSRVFHPILWSTPTPWPTGPRIFLLETGCHHQHSRDLFMMQPRFTIRVLLQGQMLMRGLLARLIWRTTLRRRGRGELIERSASERSIIGLRLSSSLVLTHSLCITRFHRQDQEGRQEHNSDLVTLSSPNSYYPYCF